MKNHLPSAEQLKLDWANNPRWAGVTRTYSALILCASGM